MVIPLTDVGAVKATTACLLPAVTETPLGALGTVAVSAKTRVAAFKRSKLSKQDFRCLTGKWRAMFIGWSSGVHTQ